MRRRKHDCTARLDGLAGWSVPFGIVRVIYPEVEDVFNHVDSKEDWNNLGPGDRGEVGLFEWEWIE